MKKIFINSNTNKESVSTAEKIKNILTCSGFELIKDNPQDADFIISVGGDGTILRTLEFTDYPDTPLLAINTGHMGFFSDLSSEDIDKIPRLLSSGDYSIQKYRTIETKLTDSKGNKILQPALNDVLVIRHVPTSLIHLKLNIKDTMIENFSGDGVLVSSPAGSTAYNYSLGGSIVGPDLDLLQITPVAPANNAYFRSFTSSILLPPDETINIIPENNGPATIIIDGKAYIFFEIKEIEIKLSEKQVSIVRLPSYNFWEKITSKFL